MVAPFVSVIVPCRNEAASLARCLDSILSSDYPPEALEVIVADGASVDASAAVAAWYAARDGRVRLIENPQRITPAALNRAIAAARGTYILRVDAHSTIAPDYVRTLTAYLEDAGGPTLGGGVWSAGGAMRTVTEGAGPMAAAIRLALSHRFGVGNSGFRTAAGTSPGAGHGSEARETDAIFNGCWPRTVFGRIGGFDERLRRSQDIAFSLRIRAAGGRLMLLPWIESDYYIAGTYRTFLRQSWTNGVWALLPLRHLGRAPVRLRHLAPLAFVAALAGSCAVAVLAPWRCWLPLGIAGPYLAANVTVSCRAGWQARDGRLAALAPLVFGTLHLAYGAGSLWGAVQAAAGRIAARFRRRPADESGRAAAATGGNP